MDSGGQIMYNYPGMLGTVGEMHGQGAGLRAVAESITSEQGVLAQAWNGDTGGQFQAWATMFMDTFEQFNNAQYQLTHTHENNTLTMAARDMAEGAKWGG